MFGRTLSYRIVNLPITRDKIDILTLDKGAGEYECSINKTFGIRYTFSDTRFKPTRSMNFKHLLKNVSPAQPLSPAMCLAVHSSMRTGGRVHRKEGRKKYNNKYVW